MQPPKHLLSCHDVRRLVRWACACAMLGTLFGWLERTASGQSLWEVSPYDMQIWIALESDPRVPPSWRHELAVQLERSAAARVGAAWQIEASTIPGEFLADALQRRELNLAEFASLSKRLAAKDKIVVLIVERKGQQYQLTCREYDARTRIWSAWQQVSSSASGDVATAAFGLICDVFVPILRIERIQDEVVTASVRAGALLRVDDSPRRWRLPIEVDEGDVLRPVLRRSDRNGNVGPDGVKPIEWTVLVVNQRNQSRVACGWYSGYRQPFRTRRSSRVEQVALVVKPRLSETTLKLVNRKQPQQPLIGYEVYARDSEQDPSRLVGRSNYHGEVSVPRDLNRPVQILYVRSGRQLLGKLPVVPGDTKVLVAALRNDDQRLEAEGFLLGVQESLVDLVARREVLASRIRRHLAKNELDAAETLLNTLRRLDTQADFTQRVQQRKRSLSSADPQVQSLIDQLFAQTRTLLGQYLSREQVEELSRALSEAKAR